MSVIIYGGAFNPPHKGHESVVTLLSQTYPEAHILVIPTHLPPHKVMEKNAPSTQERLALCQLSFGHLPNVEISDVELQQEGTSYTWNTIQKLKKQYPHQRFSLVVGSDQLLSFRQWHSYKSILRKCALLVVSREKGDRDELEQMARSLRETEKARVTILQKEPLVISSQKLREAVVAGKTELLKAYLSPEVLTVITQNHYYLEDT